MPNDIPKAYDPHSIEDRLYSSWEEQGLFRDDRDFARYPGLRWHDPSDDW